MRCAVAFLLGTLLFAGCGHPQTPEFQSVQEDPEDLVYPAYADLSRVSVSSDGDDLKVTFECRGFVPEILPRGEDWHVRVYLDTNADNGAEYYIAYKVYPFVTKPKLYDYTTQVQYVDASFPGSYLIATQTVELTVPIERLDYPTSVRWHAVSEWNAYTLDSTRDWLPDDNPDSWIKAVANGTKN